MRHDGWSLSTKPRSAGDGRARGGGGHTVEMRPGRNFFRTGSVSWDYWALTSSSTEPFLGGQHCFMIFLTQRHRGRILRKGVQERGLLSPCGGSNEADGPQEGGERVSPLREQDACCPGGQLRLGGEPAMRGAAAEQAVCSQGPRSKSGPSKGRQTTRLSLAGTQTDEDRTHPSSRRRQAGPGWVETSPPSARVSLFLSVLASPIFLFLVPLQDPE